MNLYYFVSLLLLISLIAVTNSKKLWGSKKKSKDDEKTNTVIEDTSNNIINIPKRYQKDIINNNNKLFNQIKSYLSSTDLTETINDLIIKIEELIDTPEFISSIPFDSLAAAFDENPMLNEYRDKFDLIKSQDPLTLKITIKNAFNEIKKYSNDIASYLTDSEKLQELINLIPIDAQETISSVLSGDSESLLSLLQNIPELSSAQKNLFSGLLTGQTNELKSAVQEVLQDEDLIEQARLQFLENPDLAESLGIPFEVISDRRKWNELMKEGFEDSEEDSLFGSASSI